MIIKIWNESTKEYDLNEYDCVPRMGETVLLDDDRYYIVDDVIHDFSDNSVVLQIESTNGIPYGYDVEKGKKRGKKK